MSRSFDDLLKKQRELEKLERKPVYLTKKEREEIALQVRQREALEKKRKPTDAPESVKSDEKLLCDSDLKERYMGGDKPKRKYRRYADRKFVFDWDEKEDTTEEPKVEKKSFSLYGRGKMAGIDVTEEKVDTKHWSEKPLYEMTERDWRILKEDFNLSSKGGRIPHPLRSWLEAPVAPSIKRVIDELGYKEPTPIQRAAIPVLLHKRDAIGIAETGSGKTAAFLIPAIQHIQTQPPMDEQRAMQGPYVMVMAPTRELAQQIDQEAQKFAQKMGFKTVCIVGGHAIEEQSFNLRNGAEMIIGTPGRLLDCLEQRIIVLNQCHLVVLDEADRMVDMGFEQDLIRLLDSIPLGFKPDNDLAENDEYLVNHNVRQTVMFSATMPPAVERIAYKYLKRPVTVTVGLAGQAVDSVEQIVEFVHEEKKKYKKNDMYHLRARMFSILNQGFLPPIIIFVRQKRLVDTLTKTIEREGFKAVPLHGGKNQEQREQAISLLKRGEKEILVATDVASRGLDIKDVSLVINYDMAKNIEDYTHRIGRTGRAGKKGVAITFLTNDDHEVFYDLKAMLLASKSSSCPTELMHHEAAKNKPGTFTSKKKSDETIFNM